MRNFSNQKFTNLKNLSNLSNSAQKIGDFSHQKHRPFEFDQMSSQPYVAEDSFPLKEILQDKKLITTFGINAKNIFPLRHEYIEWLQAKNNLDSIASIDEHYQFQKWNIIRLDEPVPEFVEEPMPLIQIVIDEQSQEFDSTKQTDEQKQK